MPRSSPARRACGFAATRIKKKQESLFLHRRSDYNAPFPVNNTNPIADTARAMHIGPYQLKNNLIVAPMAGGPSTPELAAAGTNAGGLGFVAAGYLTAEVLAERLQL